MKKICLYFVIIILVLSLSGCQSLAVPKDNEVFGEGVSQLGTYYISDNSIYCRTGDSTELICTEEKSIGKLCMLDSSAYYSISDALGYNFEIKNISSDGKSAQTVISKDGLSGEQLIDWQICDENILFTVNTNLYRYSVSNGEIKLLHDDVSTFDYYNGYVYFLEHASRTSTIYKAAIDGGKKEVVLGLEIYDAENPKELISNFIITDNGDIVYTQRIPYGLFIYSDGKTELIKSANGMDDIDEDSMVYDKGNIYYVLRNEGLGILYCYTDAKEHKEVAQLQDYSKLISVENGCYSYKNTNGEVITE